MEIRLIAGQQNLSQDLVTDLLQVQAREFVAPIQQGLIQAQAQGLVEQAQALLAELVQVQEEVVAQARAQVLQAPTVDQLVQASQALAVQESLLARIRLAQGV